MLPIESVGTCGFRSVSLFFNCLYILISFQDELKKQSNQLAILNNGDAREILVRYIARDCAHLAETEKKAAMKRKIQTNRLAQIRRDQEKSIMLLNSTGLEAPNFSNLKQLNQWISWDGEVESMQKVYLIFKIQ